MTITDPFTEGRPVPNEPIATTDAPEPEPPTDLEGPPAGTNGHHTNGHRPARPAPDAHTPPHDLQAERALLGAALIGHPLDTPPDAFYHPPHGHIATAIRHLQTQGAAVDPVTLTAELDRRHLLDHAGGTPTIAQLLEGAPATSAAPSYARIVTDHHRARQLITAAAELAHTVRTAGPDAGYALLAPLLDTHQPQQPADRMRDGTWLLDAPTTAPALWGTGDEVLWAEGEPLLLTGPPGVGKTTLTAQILRCRLGLQDALLGWPITPDPGRILYLASDRPAQIRRALARSFTEDDRPALEHHLTIWPGPPPADLGRHPDTLHQLATQAGATTVILDSLKDMAIGLADDEVGAGLNRSIQTAIADGIQVLALHHQRKGTDGKRPKTLEDLYGSTWIPAGAGSVLLLWGQAGDLVVELHHLKQPSADIGPLKLEHDHHAGTTRIHRGFDLHTALRHAPKGLTTLDVTRMWLEKDKPTENERRKAQRRLDNLVRAGQATRREPEHGGHDGTEPARYYAVDHHTQETF